MKYSKGIKMMLIVIVISNHCLLTFFELVHAGGNFGRVSGRRRGQHHAQAGYGEEDGSPGHTYKHTMITSKGNHTIYTISEQREWELYPRKSRKTK